VYAYAVSLALINYFNTRRPRRTVHPVQNYSSTDTPLLRAINLHGAHFGPLSLQLVSTECAVVQGASGAGKTLLLRALADIIPADGQVWLAGVLRNEIPAPDWRRQVALLPAESYWWADMVRSHFASEPMYELSAVGFDADVLDWPVSRLSSGERQRLSLVRLLGNRPRVLLLDEPTANLDAENIKRVESLIKTYMQQHQAGALWITHDAEQTARVGKRIIRVANGRLLSKDQA
jgi:ABC-type iron transport system FetAB ATPase subunit